MEKIDERISEKTKDIEKYLDELLSMVPESFQAYQESLMARSACERHFEKVIEAVVDLAFLFFRKKDWYMPNSDTDAFKILGDKKVIDENLSHRLEEAKSMRNFIVHLYKEVNDLMVYTAITEELENDVKSFIKSIRENIV